MFHQAFSDGKLNLANSRLATLLVPICVWNWELRCFWNWISWSCFLSKAGYRFKRETWDLWIEDSFLFWNINETVICHSTDRYTPLKIRGVALPLPHRTHNKPPQTASCCLYPSLTFFSLALHYIANVGRLFTGQVMVIFNDPYVKQEWVSIPIKPRWKKDIHKWPCSVTISDLLQVHYPLHSLRSASDELTLQQPYYQTQEYGGRSFAVVAPSLWNRLPVDIKNAPSLASFKRKLTTFLFNQL